MAQSPAPLLYVKISTPEKILWEGNAQWVSSNNSAGPFDILPLHANFVTFVENDAIKIKTPTTIEKFTFTHSLMYVHENKVMIYTNL